MLIKVFDVVLELLCALPIHKGDIPKKHGLAEISNEGEKDAHQKFVPGFALLIVGKVLKS